MGDVQTAVKTAIATLAVIYVLNMFAPTRQLVQIALHGE